MASTDASRSAGSSSRPPEAALGSQGSSGSHADQTNNAASTSRARAHDEVDQLVENARTCQRNNEPFKRLLRLVPNIVKREAPGNAHIYCAKAVWAPPSLGVQAAMIRCYAFTPTPELDDWLNVQTQSYLSCEDCFDGYLRARKMASEQFLNELPPDRVKQFQDHIDNENYGRLQKLLSERGISSGDDLDRLSPSEMYTFLHYAVARFVAHVGTSPDPKHRRKAEEDAKQEALRNLLAGVSETRRLHNVQRLSPALFLLLAGPDAKLRKWAHLHLHSDGGLPPGTDTLHNPVFPSAVRHIQSTLSSETVTVETRAQIWSALKVTLQSDKVAFLTDQLAGTVLAHLQDNGTHVQDILNCFERILSLSGVKLFAAQANLADFTTTMLGRVTDSPAVLSLLSSTSISYETKRRDLLNWMQTFFAVLVINARRSLSELAFRDCLKSITHWCFERTQGSDVSPNVAELIMRGGLELLVSIADRLYPHRSRELKITVRKLDREIGQTDDVATVAQRASEAVTDAQKVHYRNVLRETLDFHAKAIVGVAAGLHSLSRDATSANKSDALSGFATTLLESVLKEDAQSVSEMVFRLSEHTTFYRNEIARGSSEGGDPMFKRAQLTLLEAVPVCSGLWRATYGAAVKSYSMALIALKAVVPLIVFRPVDSEDVFKTHLLPAPAVKKADPEKSGPKDPEYQRYVRRLRAMVEIYEDRLKDTRWGVFRVMRELMDFESGAEREDFLRRLCKENTDVVLALAHSAVPDIRNSALSFSREVFDDSNTRQSCLRALIEENPTSAIEGLIAFLRVFEVAAAKLIEASQAAAYMVRSFADIISILCGPDGLLRSGSKSSIRDRPRVAKQVADPLATLWKLMCGSVEAIYDRTPQWSKILARQELLAWFRDVNLFATEMLDSVDVVQAAIDSVRAEDENTAQADLVAEFSRPVIAAFQWLRLNDTETLHSSFIFVQRAVERVMDSAAVQSGQSDAAQSLKSKLESLQGKAKDGKLKCLLSKTQLGTLRVLIYGEEEATRREEELVDSDDDVEFVDVNPAGRPRPQSSYSSLSPTKVAMRQSSIVASMARASEIQGDAPPRPKAGLSSAPAITKSRNAYQSASSSATKRADRAPMGSKNSTLAKLKAAHKSGLPKAGSRSSLPVAPAARSSVTGALNRTDRDSTPPAVKSRERIVVDDDPSPEKPKQNSLLALQETAEEVRIRQRNAIENMKRKRAEMRGTTVRVDPHLEAERARRDEEMRKHKLQAEPNFSQLHEVILGWSSAPSADTPPNFDVNTLRHVPQTFTNAQDYLAAFEPFFILDTWASFCQAREELQLSSVPPLSVSVTSRSSIDRLTELVVTLQVTDPKLVRLSDTDVMLVSAEAGPRSVLAKVQEVRREGTNYAITLRLNLRHDPQQLSPELAPGSRWKLQRIFSLSTTHRAYEALMKVQHFKLRDDVLKAQPYVGPSVPYWDVEKVLRRLDVNPPQAQAIVHALGSTGFSLIQGPPGTGKTKTICGLLQQSFNIGHTRMKRPKIFICAPSNAAIDEVARRAKAIVLPNGNKLAIVRVGRTEKISSAVADITLDVMVDAKMAVSDEGAMLKDASQLHALNQQLRDEINEIKKKIKEVDSSGKGKDTLGELFKQRREKEKRRQDTLQHLDEVKDKQKDTKRQQDADRIKFRRQILDGADVICSTLSGAGQDAFGNMEFDTVIIDEAAQAVELETLIPLRFDCQRCILVGDQNQLPPTVLSGTAKKYGYAKSLFVRMFENCPERVHLLSIQYRMHPEISRLPSDTFYQSRLTDGPDMEKQTTQPWHDDPLLGPFKFFSCRGREMKGRSHSLKNSDEVDVALSIYTRLRMLWKADLDYRVGIISPYKDQVNQLRYAFEVRYDKDISNRVDFNTVDGFQGQEKDIIIFSCVRSGEVTPNSSVGFVKDPRRANVALTRAKSNLFIIGNAPFLRNDPVWGYIVWHAEKRELLHEVRPCMFDQSVHKSLLPPPPKEGFGKAPQQMGLYEALRSAGMLARQQTASERGRGSYQHQQPRNGSSTTTNESDRGAEAGGVDTYWAPTDATAAAKLKRNLAEDAGDSDGDSLWGDGSDDEMENGNGARREVDSNTSMSSAEVGAGGRDSVASGSKNAGSASSAGVDVAVDVFAGQKRPASRRDSPSENGTARPEKAARTSSSTSASRPSGDKPSTTGAGVKAKGVTRPAPKTTVVFTNVRPASSSIAVARPKITPGVGPNRPAGTTCVNPQNGRPTTGSGPAAGDVVPSAGALSALFVKKRK